MDWTDCELVEVIPGKVSGVPLIVGTRIQADIIFEYLDSAGGLDELAEDFPSLSRGQIQELAAFANSRRLRAVSRKFYSTKICRINCAEA